MRKLRTVAYGKYTAFILPRNGKDLSFEKTVKILKSLFGAKKTLFIICLLFFVNCSLIWTVAKLVAAAQRLMSLKADTDCHDRWKGNISSKSN